MVTSSRRLNFSALFVLLSRSLALLLFLLIAGAVQHAQAAVTLVQHTSRDFGSTNTGSLAFVSPNTAANWIAVVIRGGSSSSQVFTVTDSNGNPVKILKVGDSANSTIIMALLGTGPFAPGNPNGWVQMPAFQSTMFSTTQVSALAAWIDLGCHE